MKKLIIPLFALLLFSCSKDKDACYWTNGNGDYLDNKPSADQIAKWEQQCGCTVTWYKECP